MMYLWLQNFKWKYNITLIKIKSYKKYLTGSFEYVIVYLNLKRFFGSSLTPWLCKLGGRLAIYLKDRHIISDSSTVELSAVNRMVAGSNPALRVWNWLKSLQKCFWYIDCKVDYYRLIFFTAVMIIFFLFWLEQRF